MCLLTLRSDYSSGGGGGGGYGRRGDDDLVSYPPLRGGSGASNGYGKGNESGRGSSKVSGYGYNPSSYTNTSTGNLREAHLYTAFE